MPRLILICALMLVPLTGCGGASAPELVTDRGGADSLPAAARPATSDGALAFATHYIHALNYARSSGDVNGLLPLEDGECRTCQALRHAIAQVYDNGGTITGGAWKIDTLGSAETVDDWPIDGQINVTRQQVSGTEDDAVTPADTVPITMQLARVGDTWKVLECVRGE